ncbi:MAPEG family protein [Sulfitobacter mediterraneus]|uniref:MAPEG family protein n=1 Tax=Sulfitobacter mediterraneus TaxID=83219 RepID=UPI00193AAC0A|nr:MAPEG family protein [Sulfitobacter mediterraneus]MBM1557612.1 MAPEG family protein [Sulfitobacter mediterraneus]MBM1569341.1 MAPEG family protein [Sulfitobacter mediterraneus]MBM1572785.1 MAPEG family protein [Sulfitobacter mediterraneus]MBM1576948.1 MAPEG family protein [Sulfitobacter mediterraneus]MBM1580552.1 MAPEG family protein [Sulfitobacter mediterraneus]
MAPAKDNKAKFRAIIIAYPVALIAIALAINLLLFGVDAAVVSLPSKPVIAALAMGAVLLVINHTVLMTTTELTRMKYDLKATPEEWAASDHNRADITAEAETELERQHNAHRNATENTVYFAMLAITLGLITPVQIAAQVWIIGFALGRLGHGFAYLTGRDGLRGICMSVSLIALYGMGSYLALALIL